MSVNRVGEFIWIDVEADGFLYNMVRAIAGTLMNVGRGFWPEDTVAEILNAEDRREAGPTAPPQGLFLMRVTYEDRETRRRVTADQDLEALEIRLIRRPPSADGAVPGSKSITNRALVLAAPDDAIQRPCSSETSSRAKIRR